jgi:hypothetical protein
MIYLNKETKDLICNIPAFGGIMTKTKVLSLFRTLTCLHNLIKKHLKENACREIRLQRDISRKANFNGKIKRRKPYTEDVLTG